MTDTGRPPPSPMRAAMMFGLLGLGFVLLGAIALARGDTVVGIGGLVLGGIDLVLAGFLALRQPYVPRVREDDQ